MTESIEYLIFEQCRALWNQITALQTEMHDELNDVKLSAAGIPYAAPGFS